MPVRKPPVRARSLLKQQPGIRELRIDYEAVFEAADRKRRRQRGTARQASRGSAWLGTNWHGRAVKPGHSGATLGKARPGRPERPGPACPGEARRGVTRSGSPGLSRMGMA